MPTATSGSFATVFNRNRAPVAAHSFAGLRVNRYAIKADAYQLGCSKSAPYAFNTVTCVHESSLRKSLSKVTSKTTR